MAGLLLIMLLPGYALVLALFAKKRLDFSERILLSVISSISANILSLFILNTVLKIPLNTNTLPIEILALTIIFSAIYLLRTRELPYVYIEDIDLGSALKTASVIAVLALNFTLVYSIHTGYKYPYIQSEWHHLAEGVKFVDSSGIDHRDPYYRNSTTASDAGLLETGFGLLLAEILLLTGQKPVLVYPYLPAVFACVSALAAYAFTYRITKNHVIGLISMLFFAGLQSNINVTGPWFFLPLTLGFPFVYTILYLTTESAEKSKKAGYILAALALAALSLIHPWTTAITLPIIAAYFLTRPGLVKKNAAGLAALILTPLLLLAYAYTNYGISLEYLSKNFVIRGLNIPVKEITEPAYLLNVYGILPLILALAGIAYIVIRNKKKERIVALWAMLAASDILLFHAAGLTILAPYEAVLYYLMLALIPLSAIGLYKTLEKIDGRIRNNTVTAILTIAALAAVAYTMFAPYYENGQDLYRIIDNGSFEGLKWLEQNRGHHNVVLSRPETSSAIYPLTGNYVVSVLGVNSSGLEDNRRFFRSDCDGKKQIIIKHGVDYLFLKKDDRIGCDYARTIYSQKGVYIYEVDKNALENGNP